MEDKQKAVLLTKSLHGELVYAKAKQGSNKMPRMQVILLAPSILHVFSSDGSCLQSGLMAAVPSL